MACLYFILFIWQAYCILLRETCFPTQLSFSFWHLSQSLGYHNLWRVVLALPSSSLNLSTKLNHCDMLSPDSLRRNMGEPALLGFWMPPRECTWVYRRHKLFCYDFYFSFLYFDFITYWKFFRLQPLENEGVKSSQQESSSQSQTSVISWLHMLALLSWLYGIGHTIHSHGSSVFLSLRHTPLHPLCGSRGQF